MKKVEENKKEIPYYGLSRSLINLLGILLGITAAYFMTIQSLKVDLATKAESAVVEVMNRKLAGLEVLIQQGVVTSDQFDRFSTDTESRLIRIENYLIDNSGERRGR